MKATLLVPWNLAKLAVLRLRAWRLRRAEAHEPELSEQDAEERTRPAGNVDVLDADEKDEGA